eukprot:scaffold20057_cov61-Phaeocystis_antarctica.AAC.9
MCRSEPNERLRHGQPPQTPTNTPRRLQRTGLTSDVEQQLLKWKARPTTKLQPLTHPCTHHLRRARYEAAPSPHHLPTISPYLPGALGHESPLAP